MLPRRFALVRHVDYTGVSGVGVVAYGVTFADGHVVLRWCSAHPATSMWSSVDDLLAIHGHGEATSIEWIDAPHGDLEEFTVTPSRGRRGRRRAERESAPDEAGTGDVPATDTTGIPAAGTAVVPAASTAGVPAAATAADQAAAELAEAQAAAAQPAEAEPAQDTANAGDDPTATSDPIRRAQDAESVAAGDDTHPEPEPAGEPSHELEPAPKAWNGSAGRKPTTEVERPRPQSTPGAGPTPGVSPTPGAGPTPSAGPTPGASPVRTDELTATQVWPAWTEATGSEPVARPAASFPERPAIRDVRQESPSTRSGSDRSAEPRRIQRIEPPSRDDPESTDPFASVLSEEPPEFRRRNNGHQHVDTITGLLDLPADLVNNRRSTDSSTSNSRTANSRPEPPAQQLRRAGRHRRDEA